MIKFNILLIILVLCCSLSAYGGDAVIKADLVDSNVVAKISTVKLPKMIDLGSKSCIPCKRMAPILDSLREEYKGRAEIEFIDIKENRKASSQYKITLIPTQIFFDTLGAEVYRHVGFFPADSIVAHLTALGVNP